MTAGGPGGSGSAAARRPHSHGMADLIGTGSADRDIDKILVALKKGTQLLKYGRKGKPKFYLFRLSNDESTLIWFSTSGERTLKLASVSRIISGQRTSVFQRYPRPDKDYLSFSLIYNDGKRSLDLICKDKVEVEVWFSGLKTLISAGQYGRPKIDGWSNGLYNDDGREFASDNISNHSIGPTLDTSEGRLTSCGLQKIQSFEYPVYSERSDVSNMHTKGASSDGIRISTSSVPSTSSHGSAPEDFDASGDVYVWGEVISDISARVSADRNSNPSSTRTDVLLPKSLESNLVLDIHHVACGVRHAALVTRQGEVFTWGEESGGRLGHGVAADTVNPRLVESLSASNVDFVACGEFHTCAVTMSGELYTWGDGSYNAGLLGHGTDVCHWMPKRVSGILEGLQVSYVSCGVWHTALITTTGQLFSFGDGTFGVLGHGNRESLLHPREVESLTGLKTMAVSCGVWHTAAVVEVIVTQSSASSGKLFTWGDGDKHRLGHGDKEPQLEPTCVSSLIDFNFHKLACGHSLTVGLTTSGHVFTMGSTVYGQLGNPHSDGRLPCMVEDKLLGESVVEVASGSYHVAVLTARGEVYTWGRGANGRLGHGDLEDRKTPKMVEALKDRHVKHISCGSSFTAAICQHKWVSGTEQSQCSACRQAFGFTRKKHNCYNCGLVHCHQCSSRKALRAALSPNPGKPYRVCDTCYVKLTNSFDSGGFISKKIMKPRISGESKDRLDRLDTSLSKALPSSNLDLVNNFDSKVSIEWKNSNSSSVTQSPQVPSVLQLKSIAFNASTDVHQAVPRPAVKSTNRSRAVSPFSRKPSPPRSTTPTPTMAGLSFSKSFSDNLKKTNDLLNQELLRFHSEVDNLRQRCERLEFQLEKSEKKAQEATTLAMEESAKSKAAKEVIKSLTAQLKEMAKRLPQGVYDTDPIKLMHLSNGSTDSHAIQQSDSSFGNLSSNGTSDCLDSNAPGFHSSSKDELSEQNHAARGTSGTTKNSTYFWNHAVTCSNYLEDLSNVEHNGNGEMPVTITRSEDLDSPNSDSNQVEAEWIEQFEPGVYITLIALRDGTRELKRVRFSRRRFGEQQAEAWWSENAERVHDKYKFRGLNSTL
ncbi:PH, RCC1 and FYVE domains-containing protein 1-like isoform X1 [Musa acuminata AAA Group]|uniref:PH, RCC1 and FYVE domains-containing protein 1-like isoform X1 n=1 Tax=Musa acuminata AAA Group TaxID=214697 RepID=UPI0031D3E43A